MSKLSQYLEGRGISQREFADQIGVHQSIVSRLKNGTMSPRAETAFKIERATAGEVPAASWFDIEETERTAAE